MQRPTPKQEAAAAATGCTDEQLAKKFPTVVSYLTDTKYDDGSSREPSSFTVTCSAGGVQVALNDKELKQSLYSTSGTLQDALKLMEKALIDGIDAWRPWGRKKGKG